MQFAKAERGTKTFDVHDTPIRFGLTPNDARNLSSPADRRTGAAMAALAFVQSEQLRGSAVRVLACEALRTSSDPEVSALAAVALARASHDEDALTAAWCGRHLDVIGFLRSLPVDVAVAACRMSAQVHAEEGDTDGAQSVLRAMADAGRCRSAPVLKAASMGERVRLHLLHGDHGAARSLRDAMDWDTGIRCPAPVALALCSERLKSDARLMAAGAIARNPHLLAELTACRATAVSAGCLRLALELEVSACLIAKATGHHAAADGRLRRIFRILSRNGAYRCILDDHVWIARLFRELRQDGRTDGTIAGCFVWSSTSGVWRSRRDNRRPS